MKFLSDNSVLKSQILLNNDKKTKVRLVAMPVSEEIANTRRRKAKKKKNFPNSEYLELLGWSIYFTTIHKEKADDNKIFKLYRFRWRIEIIFKSWKSNMNFDKIHNISKTQPYVILTVRFIMILICSQVIFSPCKTIIRNTLNKDLSLIKITHYLMRNPEKIIQIILDLYKFPKKLSKSIQTISRYCSYDKKKKS